jgi:hypothetical protein
MAWTELWKWLERDWNTKDKITEYLFSASSLLLESTAMRLGLLDQNPS